MSQCFVIHEDKAKPRKWWILKSFSSGTVVLQPLSFSPNTLMIMMIIIIIIITIIIITIIIIIIIIVIIII